MTAAYFEDHPTDPDKVILRKPTMMWEGSLHIVCQCDKCKTQPQREWVDLTREEFAEILCDDRWQFRPELMMLQVQAKLKEKNT